MIGIRRPVGLVPSRAIFPPIFFFVAVKTSA